MEPQDEIIEVGMVVVVLVLVVESQNNIEILVTSGSLLHEVWEEQGLE